MIQTHELPQQTPVVDVYGQMLAALKQCRVELTASLPDDWVAPLIRLVDQDAEMTNVRVAREPEIIGYCAGAFFGRKRAAGIMGTTGFLTCISEIATLSLRHEIPIFLITSTRGEIHDMQVFQVMQGRIYMPLLQSLGIPHLILDRPERIALIPQAYEWGRLQKRPYVVCLTKGLIKGLPTVVGGVANP